ncbi:hypothetical protein [Mixta theicola]|uniref:hypothetical protein n=1 Tax=Mixta theicola TaxID=1458355 RepID=UPI0010572A27|nr:hypothetical protein [Mixta theicola]
MSAVARSEVLSLITDGLEDDIFGENGEGPTDLSSLQAEKLVRGLSGKSRSVLKAILENSDSSNGFWCEELASELGIEVTDLTGVWSGLTRRIRTVTGSSDAYLISWAWDDERQDYYGRMHQTTFKNCKKARFERAFHHYLPLILYRHYFYLD